MEITKLEQITNIEHILNNAYEICQEFDPNSNCRQYLIEKINQSNSTSYIGIKNNQIIGLAILEIIDRMYGNLILHCESSNDEYEFAGHLKAIIDNNILELIQFRSNFSFRDAFLDTGLREKERSRMMHHNIGQYAEVDAWNNITFHELSVNDSKACGLISYSAHKNRQHIECYDVYASESKRAEFANDLRNRKHGKAIENASLLMKSSGNPIGLIELVDVKYFDDHVGWIMDVALLPEFQGMGYGQYLIKKALSECYKTGYNKVGLGVTLSNKGAYNLYQNLGFEEYEIFVEIIGT